ncbi:MAG: HD domain-containing protein [Eubacteriales bacterium]|nr:HD domain-containing protein [Eubacteriales bacterium]
MDGIQFNRKAVAGEPAAENEPSAHLLAKQGDLEVMLYRITGESVVWLYPASDPDAIEYFFIHKGGVELAMDDGLQSLGPGESFTVSGLKQDVPVKMHGDTEILYVTNCPAYESLAHIDESLQELLTRINEKDHYTSRHSKAVLQYSLAIYDAMEDHGPDIPREDLAFAALFHDVGKCFVPVEILKKPERLEQAEFRYILRHPVDSGRMLQPKFGEQIAEIARNHHERLDGSGYPRGLREEDISLASQIVAVADSFDAMTSERGYNVVKTFLEAAQELVSLPLQYDSRITNVLMHLVSSGALEEGGAIGT